MRFPPDTPDTPPPSAAALREDAAHLGLAIEDVAAILARLAGSATDHVAITLHHDGGGHDRVHLRRGDIRAALTARLHRLGETRLELLRQARALETFGGAVARCHALRAAAPAEG